MREADIDVLLLSVGRDLPYLTGYEAMPLERLTMLVLPRRRRRHAGGAAARGAAGRRAARRVHAAAVERDRGPDRDRRRAWSAGRDVAAIGDTTWARFLVDLLAHWPSPTTRYVRSTEVMNALRMRKDAAEIAALRRRRRGRRSRSPPSCRPARSRSSAAPRPRSAPTSRRTAPRRGPPPGQLRHRRRRRERGVARTTTPATG